LELMAADPRDAGGVGHDVERIAAESVDRSSASGRTGMLCGRPDVLGSRGFDRQKCGGEDEQEYSAPGRGHTAGHVF
jgi:hypothetical protein